MFFRHLRSDRLQFRHQAPQPVGVLLTRDEHGVLGYRARRCDAGGIEIEVEGLNIRVGRRADVVMIAAIVRALKASRRSGRPEFPGDDGNQAGRLPQGNGGASRRADAVGLRGRSKGRGLNPKLAERGDVEGLPPVGTVLLLPVKYSEVVD